MCGLSERVEALPFKVWRDHIIDMVHTANFLHNFGNSKFHIIQGIRAKVAHFEDELPKLKEIMIILELALWKLRMNEKSFHEEAIRCQKKIKTDESSIRRQCRITCGADVIIQHVLPYLIITVDDQESDSYEESDSYASSDEFGLIQILHSSDDESNDST